MMVRVEDEQRFKRLPKWAQDEYRRLTTQLERVEDERNKLLCKAESNIEYDPNPTQHSRPRLFLPDNKTVRFQLPLGWIDVDLSLPGEGSRHTAFDGGLISVMGHCMGDESLVILPSSSNYFHVGFGK